ncbi:hypothetical protein ACI782_06715 [Geodermatophilus sp. SYSU D00703]
MSAHPSRRALVLGVVAAATTLVAQPALAAPPVPVTPPVPVQQLQTIEVTLESAEIGSAPGTVDVTGTVTCSTPVEAAVFGDIAQVQGLDIARDFFFVDPLVQCSSTPTTWTTTSLGALRVFLPLPTTINVSAQYCVDELGTCFTGTTTETLTLPVPTDAGPST